MSGQGISQNPPTENLPIFDTSVFLTNDVPLTINTGSKYFLRFPNAQGTENLQATNTSGIATFSNSVVVNAPAYPSVSTTMSQGQYYLNVNSNSSNSDGGVIKLTNTTPSTGGSVTMGATAASGLNINRGITIGNNNTSNGNTVSLTSDQTTNNQLDLTGNLSILGNLYTSASSFVNLANNVIINSLPSLPTTDSGSQTGFGLGWNWTSGGGETDFLSYGQGAGIVGGFNFYTSNSSTAPILMAQFAGTGNNLPLSTTTITPAAGDSSQKIATTAFVQTALGSSNPVGTILTYGGSGNTPPSGYLWCDTTAYSTTGTYAALYSVIGTYYNSPSTPAGYFNVPQFHSGTQGTAVFPVAGGCYSTSQGLLGVTQLNGTGTSQSPVICGGNSTIQLTQVPDHIHGTNHSTSNYISSLSGGSLLTAGGTQSYVISGTGTPFSNNTNTMQTTGGSPVYSSTQSQGQFYPPFCTVQYIIKY